MSRLSINYKAASLLGYDKVTHNMPFDNPECSVFQQDPDDMIAFDEVNIYENVYQLQELFDKVYTKANKTHIEYFNDSIAALGINAAMLRFVELCLEL